jgi:PAS domain S-box-containing protein
LLLLAGCLAQPAWSDTLGQWRESVVAVRTLAENDAAQAYEAAHRLERMQPPEAQAQDKVRMLNLLARIEVYLALIEAADRHAMQARQLALQTGDTIGQVEADLNVAINAINQGHIEDSMVATIRGVELLKGTARHDLLGEAMLRMSMMYRRLGQFDSSVEVTMQAMAVAKQSNDPWALMYAYQGLAISYDQSGRYPEARDYYLRMREAARQARSRLQEAHAVRGLAGVVASLGNAADAERLYREAIAMFRQTHAPFSLNFGLSGLAAMLDRHGRYAEAVELMDEVMANYTAYPNPIGAWFALNLRSTVLEHVGRQGDARRDAEHAYVLANRIGQPLYLSGSAKRLSELAAARGDFRQAYQLAKQAADQADKSAQSKAGTLMLQLAQRFETETKQRKIDELKSRNALQEAELQRNVMQQRWLWTSLFAGVALLLAGLLFVQRLRRSRAEIGALNAGLEHRVEARTAELRLSQRSLAEAQRIAHLGSWEMDLVENVLSWSDEIYRIFEIDPAAFGASYEAFMEMVHPDDRALLDRTYKEALERHQPFEIEHRLLLPDGRVKFVHERCETLYDTEGKPLRSIGTVQDVTERRSVESKLRDALAFSEGVINAIPDILIEVGRDGRYLNVWTQNPELLAAQKEQLLGKTVAEVLSPENAAAAMRAIREAEVQGASRIEDICIDLPVGKRWFSHSLSRKPGNTSGENTFLMLSRDITERKQLEEALAARERELRALAESSPGMVGSFYLKPDGTVCMPYVSPNVYALFGVRPEEIKEDATPLLRLNHPDDAQRVMDTIAESARTLEPWHCEFRIEHPHKGERWMEGHTNPSSHPDGGTVWYGYVHDITERKRIEVALQESEARYRRNFNMLRSMLESPSGVSVFALDRNYRYLAFNRRHRERAKFLRGTDIEVGLDMLASLEDEGFREFCRTGFDRVLAGESVAVESREVHVREGVEFIEYNENFGSPIFDEKGEVVGITVFAVSLNARKEAERKLKEALEFTEGVINAIPDLLFEMDGDGRSLNIWTHTPGLLAVPREKLLGRTVGEILSAESASIVMEALQEARESRVSFGKAIPVESPQGTEWFELSVSRRPGTDTFLVLSRDITARKRLESELVASRNFLDGVIESVSDPIFVKDRQHRWTLLNEAFCSFIGHARESLLGKSDYDFFPESEADEFWAKDEEVFDSGQGNLNEEDFTSADGETHFIQTKKTPFRAADGSQMLVGVIHDITERKRFETAREAALTEARRLAKARSDFIAHMSHELRTPLNTILGYAQMLEWDAGLDARQNEEVGMIRASGEHLLALIEDILDLARIEAGKFTLDLGDVSLPHLLDFVAGVTALRAQQKGIAFVCEFAVDLPSGVRGDEKRLRQVLLNLLANAVKFTDHGQVMLDVRRIGMDRLAFVVEDTGIGIPSADIETIFQPFEQSQAVGHREGGTGLGLAICRQLVRLMGGEIYVESRVGVGSRFSFELSLPALDIGLLQPVAGLDEAIDAPPLIAPSAEMMQALLRCARLGNMRDILVEAERIAALGPAYHPFAAHIKRLAEGFQSKALLAFVERYMI